MKPCIAILSTDADYYLMLSYVLDASGYETVLTDELDAALALIAGSKIVALLVDCQPESSLLSDLSSRLRAPDIESDVPVVALVSAGVRYIEILKAEVDESFIRPLKPERLLSYLHQRLNESGVAVSRPAYAGASDLRLDADARRALANEKPVALSPIEFRILSTLMSAPGRVFGRPELIEAVWPQANFVDPRTVDVHVARLRRSLHDALGREVIRTVRGQGYAVDVKG
ncbi:response regulator CheY-like domain-containing protein (plasmid) [Rhizobium etli 8C-3]|uniref:Response regulator CheY-like domain-containing protein n=2 Tax=Rhizobium TaxID=379 RepID=A0A1L5PGZ0_RHIET|nr:MULTISPECIES: response regulator transcription factor [Rhizobium]APO79509.1 response regulator CheY-like domain-containing protein [Rhizobium etli 8C-3]TCU29461.1 two-component system phosphate regulon response regulator PhoB [Rhizobium azibense]